MEIKNSRIVLGLAISVIDEAIKALQINNHFPKEFEWDVKIEVPENQFIALRFYLTFSPPDFILAEKAEGLTTLLNIEGKLNFVFLDSLGNPDLDNYGNPNFLIKGDLNVFNASVKLEIVLRKDKPTHAPVVGLKYSGINDYDFGLKDLLENVGLGNILDKSIQELEKILSEISKKLEIIRFDIIKPFLVALEYVYFTNEPDLAPPPFGAYPVYLKLVQSDTPEFKSMVAIIINHANEPDIVPELTESVLPASAELFMYVNPEFLKRSIFQIQREAMKYIQEFIAKADNCSVLDIKGKLYLNIEKSIFKITGVIINDHWLTGSILGVDRLALKGELPLRHSPGALMIFPVVSKLMIDLDTPWIIPSSYEKEWEDSIEKYVSSALKNAYNSSMQKFTEALDISKGMIEMGFPISIYPDTFNIEDNHAMTFFTQIFILPKTDDIENASYSKMFRKFILCKTKTGRNFNIADLAVLMADGWISMKGFEQVGRKHIRTIPDGDPDNNMKARFWKRTK